MSITIPGLPELDWAPSPAPPAPDAVAVDEASGVLTLTAAAGVDWSNDSLGGEGQVRAKLLGFDAPIEFTLAARVRVDGRRSTFDAGAIALWADADHWAKLCFEYSPAGEPMVVSVVTNEYSDDCNSTLVTTDAVHLRVTRTGPGWAFHSSADGERWDFVRLFRLHTAAPIRVGFLAQAPMGESCTARFDRIVLTDAAPADLRDGS